MAVSDLCQRWLLKKPAIWASRTLPPKPDSGKVPALEKPPPPSISTSPSHLQPLFLRPRSSGDSGAQTELCTPQGRRLALGWLPLPPPHQPLTPPCPKREPFLGLLSFFSRSNPAARQAVSQPTGLASHKPSHASRHPRPHSKPAAAAAPAGILALVLCACHL